MEIKHFKTESQTTFKYGLLSGISRIHRIHFWVYLTIYKHDFFRLFGSVGIHKPNSF